MFVHADIEPIKAYVREDVLYDMDVTKSDSYIKCLIIGVSSYKGVSPTFQILVAGESLFFYIPPHLLFIHKPIENSFPLNEMVYHNCPEENFVSFKMDFLTDKKLSIFLRKSKVWMDGKYLFTIDWYKGNDLLHCCSLENGQIGFFPQHKISLGEKKFLPYLKIHREWKI